MTSASLIAHRFSKGPPQAVVPPAPLSQCLCHQLPQRSSACGEASKPSQPRLLVLQPRAQTTAVPVGCGGKGWRRVARRQLKRWKGKQYPKCTRGAPQLGGILQPIPSPRHRSLHPETFVQQHNGEPWTFAILTSASWMTHGWDGADTSLQDFGISCPVWSPPGRSYEKRHFSFRCGFCVVFFALCLRWGKPNACFAPDVCSDIEVLGVCVWIVDLFTLFLDAQIVSLETRG